VKDNDKYILRKKEENYLVFTDPKNGFGTMKDAKYAFINPNSGDTHGIEEKWMVEALLEGYYEIIS
jgi:hypothetical protein